LYQMKKDASRFSPKGVLFHRTFFTAPFSASPHLPHDSFAWGAFFMRNGLPHSGCGSPFVSYDIKDCRTNHLVRQVSYFSFAFGKLSGLNLVIKKSAVDLAK
ncbi:MAG: hypothetical protein IKD59_05290, partial [Lachnospiraceae bacterium]|nr:hypothetical protein [Lachnospiraceae bacterium]